MADSADQAQTAQVMLSDLLSTLSAAMLHVWGGKKVIGEKNLEILGNERVQRNVGNQHFFVFPQCNFFQVK